VLLLLARCGVVAGGLVLTPMMLELGVAPAVSVASTQVRHFTQILPAFFVTIK
jgi:hypothetical protein